MTTEHASASDQDLLAAHVEGDPEAFAELVRRHRDRLWAVALRTMGNREDAADGLQDGLIAAYRRAGSFRGDSAVTTWLHRVVVNACLDRIRAAKVRAADALPDDVDEHAARGTLVASATTETDPAVEAVAQERRQAVLAALRQLPAEQRAALVLVDMEGYPVAEVAQMLDCAAGTVKSRCARGRAKLASLLDLFAPDRDASSSDGNQPGSSAVPPGDRPRGPP